MINILFSAPDTFLTRARKIHIPIIPLDEKRFKTWIKKQKARIKTITEQSGFKGQASKACLICNDKGELEVVLAGINSPVQFYDFSETAKTLAKSLDKSFSEKASFALDTQDLNIKDLQKAHIGWGLAAYEYSGYKKSTKAIPKLLWSKEADKKAVTSMVETLCLLRNLINTPANDLSPETLEKAARHLGKNFDAKITAVKDQKKLQKDFPLIHMVGKAGEEAPRLVELNWGKKTHPKVTIVGKGVTFDTGGLNLKPTQYMRLMKKDMGGAAHALSLGKLIMDAGLKVNLTILLPIVENAVSDKSFRPGDVVVARNGTAVENTNTDAEGRLIVADALTYACESKPDLLVDYCTLTGSARAALGPDIPAFFASNDKTGAQIQKLSFETEDPLWQMPLWSPYKKHIKSDTGDIVNSAGLPGDLIYSALFLQHFLKDNPDWIHIDCYAWEHTGRAGRPRGGADTGLRTIFEYIKERYN